MPEEKEIIEDSLLGEKPEVLEIPVESFRNYDENPAINIVSNTFTTKVLLPFMQ